MGFLHARINRLKSERLERNSQPNDVPARGEEIVRQDHDQKIPLSKLRDLRPEKDPMGAGRVRQANAVRPSR